jgi:hypothetical protein
VGLNRVERAVLGEAHTGGFRNGSIRVEVDLVHKSAGVDLEVGTVCGRLEVGGGGIAAGVGLGVDVGKNVVTSKG